MNAPKQAAKEDSPIIADYIRVPDHSDLRGFSYRAPSNFDYRDEQKAVRPGVFQRIRARLLGGKV